MGRAGWDGCPHLDLRAAYALTGNSADHEALRSLVQQTGELRLSTQLDLRDMLRPAVQPGGRRLIMSGRRRHVTLTFLSDESLAVKCASGENLRGSGCGAAKSGCG